MYVIVGIYGYGYCQAGMHVVGIFSSKGLLLAEEGTLVESVIYLGILCVSLATAGVSCVFVHENPDLMHGIKYPIESTFLATLFVGYGIAQAKWNDQIALNQDSR